MLFYEEIFSLKKNVSEFCMSLDALSRLEILSRDSQYDLACACSTSSPLEKRRRSADGKWLYPVPLAAGGYGIMFKTLLSNGCSNDCKYCPLRSGSNVMRCSLIPEEAVNLFLEHNRRQWLLGLFLSSGVVGNPEKTMTNLIDTATILRKKHHYRGYINLKIIPGASDAAIEEAMKLSSAVSLNIEVPGKKHFEKLSHAKNFDHDIVAPLKLISKLKTNDHRYARIQTSSQFIVGASDETDREIIAYMDGMYNRLKFNRLYFSAYQTGLGDRSIPGEQYFELDPGDRLTREHRLYQVDWLLRKYHFLPKEMVFDANGNLSLEADPKKKWADAHPEFFPINVNLANREHLLRVPGLGPIMVDRILNARLIHRLTALGEAGITPAYAERVQQYLTF